MKRSQRRPATEQTMIRRNKRTRKGEQEVLPEHLNKKYISGNKEQKRKRTREQGKQTKKREKQNTIRHHTIAREPAHLPDPGRRQTQRKRWTMTRTSGAHLRRAASSRSGAREVAADVKVKTGARQAAEMTREERAERARARAAKQTGTRGGHSDGRTGEQRPTND